MEREDNRKNILVINDYGLSGEGGAENRIRTLIGELKKRNYFNEVHILHLKKHVQPNMEGLSFHPLSENKYSDYKLVLEIIEKHSIDIVQAHNLLEVYPLVLLAAKRKKKPVVWFVHDFWALCGLRTFINPHNTEDNVICEKTSFMKCSRCLGIRGYLRQKLCAYLMDLTVDAAVLPGSFIEKIFKNNNFLTKKIKIVYPWIRYEELAAPESAVKRQNYDILFVGSLASYKGAWQAVLALGGVLKFFPEARLKIIGPDQETASPHRKKIEDLAGREGVLQKIDFLGYMGKDELMMRYKQAGVLVFSSDWAEIFGQVWAEALFFGCPVIASDIGGPGEFLGDYGILYPRKDYVKLAQAICQVFSERKVYLDKAQAGGKFIAENFNINRASRNMIKVYEEVLTRK